MALDGEQQNGGAPKTVEQLFNSDHPTPWNESSGLGKIHDQEEDYMHHAKKLSVLAKVKEKAKKWRQTLVRKKHGHDANHTPSWGVALEDYEGEEHPEYHGAATHQSHYVHKGSGDNGTHHPTSDLALSDKHNTSSNTNNHPSDSEKEMFVPLRGINKTGPSLTKSHSNYECGNSSIPKVTTHETLRVRSFPQDDRQNHPSPSEVISEALTIRKSADKQNEKPLCSEITVEAAPFETNVVKGKAPVETNVVEDKVDHLSDSKTATDSMIYKSNADEEKEIMFTPRNTIEELEYSPRIPRKVDQESGKPGHNSEMAGQESPQPWYSPRKIDQETEKTAHSPKKISETESDQTNNVMPLMEELEKKSPTKMKAITEAVSGKLAPAYATVSEATSKITSKIQGLSITSPQGDGEERQYDKGVSVTEYFKNKLEPGEDERALSQVISEVISPRRSPAEKGVVAKMKTAVTLLLQSEEPSASSSMKTSDSSSRIPVSTNAHEVEEENQGRVLQAN